MNISESNCTTPLDSNQIEPDSSVNLGINKSAVPFSRILDECNTLKTGEKLNIDFFQAESFLLITIEITRINPNLLYFFVSKEGFPPQAFHSIEEFQKKFEDKKGQYRVLEKVDEKKSQPINAAKETTRNHVQNTTTLPQKPDGSLPKNAPTKKLKANWSATAGRFTDVSAKKRKEIISKTKPLPISQKVEESTFDLLDPISQREFLRVFLQSINQKIRINPLLSDNFNFVPEDFIFTKDENGEITAILNKSGNHKWNVIALHFREEEIYSFLKSFEEFNHGTPVNINLPPLLKKKRNGSD